MKHIILLYIYLFPALLWAQNRVIGIVSDSNGNPLEKVSIVLLSQGLQQSSAKDGSFAFLLGSNTRIQFSMVGYERKVIELDKGRNQHINVVLSASQQKLDEVLVNTGYYKVDKSRVTGSFNTIDNKQLQFNPNGNIIERLEGITPSLQFDRKFNVNENVGEPALRLRGLSSIQSSTEPLIILDNFPYKGSINTINPDDIESITILKDAAAASIWGARAGNGVIVLTTKKGRAGDAIKVSFGTQLVLSDRPDLFYNLNFLDSKSMMEIEKTLFDRGYYKKANQTMLPDYVSLLFKLKENKIDQTEFDQIKNRMEMQDIRQEAREELYRQAVTQRYNLMLSGGSTKNRFVLSGSFNKDLLNVIGNKAHRYTLRGANELKLTSQLTLNTEVQVARLDNVNNGYNLTNLNGTRTLSPYTFLRNVDGTAASTNYKYLREYVEQAESTGLLNWDFKPLEDRELLNKSNKSKNLLLAAGLNYRLLDGLSLDLKYQYQNISNSSQNWYDKDSYYVRNLVNQYTQTDMTRIIPYGGILEGGTNRNIVNHNFRLQGNYQKKFATNYELSALAGAEISANLTKDLPGFRLFDYNRDILTNQIAFDYTNLYKLRPNGSARVPVPPNNMQDITERFLSYFANVSLTIQDRHSFSGSVRWDASNIFGVKTNQKGVPLWSLGAKEKLIAFDFLKNNWLSQLDVRATYGVNGNINAALSALPSAFFNNYDLMTGLPYSQLRSAGNPNLRWEKIKILNLGLDFGFLKQRLTGSVEYFHKKGTDLIGQKLYDPTTGISPVDGTYYIDNLVNYANMITKGLDFNLRALLLQGNFKWSVNTLLSYTSNKVTDYMAASRVSTSSYVTSPVPTVGKSLDQLYAWKFGGLSAENGMILTPSGDQDYLKYMNNAKIEDLEYVGLRFPPWQGSLMQSFNYKGFELNANIEFKMGFYLRRASIDYSKLFANGIGNRDYERRWQKIGDEQFTTVPATPTNVDNRRDALYANSMALIEKGDFVRLSNIQMAYTFKWRNVKSVQTRVFAVVNNLGMLYRANKSGLDPDFYQANYPKPRTYTIGVQLDF
ncbi:SusC/RagA family TonB-linked outer membrane protein [Sphingobacterium siyangense]|uniref:SusC/RagA family TonB-linked outer membrane protein n=1 Tax=Sphingobacterium siyangense TaxID=459529 RepID=UPI003DA23B25